jgi:hypothetical protein
MNKIINNGIFWNNAHEITFVWNILSNIYFVSQVYDTSLFNWNKCTIFIYLLLDKNIYQ